MSVPPEWCRKHAYAPAVLSEVPVLILMVQEEEMQFALSPQPKAGMLSPCFALCRFKMCNCSSIPMVLCIAGDYNQKIKMYLCNWLNEDLNSSLLAFLGLIKFECLDFFF